MMMACKMIIKSRAPRGFDSIGEGGGLTNQRRWLTTASIYNNIKVTFVEI